MAKKNVGDVVKIREDLKLDNYRMALDDKVGLIANGTTPEKVAMAGQEVKIDEICSDCGQYIINGLHFTDEMFADWVDPVFAVGDVVKTARRFPMFEYKGGVINPLTLMMMNETATNKVGKILKVDEDGCTIWVDFPEYTEMSSEGLPIPIECLYKTTEEELVKAISEIEITMNAPATTVLQ